MAPNDKLYPICIQDCMLAMIRFLLLEDMWMGINSQIMERQGRLDWRECVRGQTGKCIKSDHLVI